MHIDQMCLQQNATQMLRGNTVPSPWGELTKYKCLVPAQNRLPNAPGGGNGGWVEQFRN